MENKWKDYLLYVLVTFCIVLIITGIVYYIKGMNYIFQRIWHMSYVEFDMSLKLIVIYVGVAIFGIFSLISWVYDKFKKDDDDNEDDSDNEININN